MPEVGDEFINRAHVRSYAEHRRRKKSLNIERTADREAAIKLYQKIVKLNLLKLKPFITDLV